MSSKSGADGQTAVIFSGRPAFWQSKRQRLLIVAFVLSFGLIGLATIIWAQGATTTHRLWPNNPTPKTITVNLKGGIELGLKFKAKNAGYVTGVRFYKGAQNTGTHTGSLWDSKGKLLARTTFKNETRNGWQTATFPQPVSVAANVTYVISYYAPVGYYSSSANYFRDATYTNGPLKAPRSTSTNGNGVYASGSSTTFPNKSNAASNYWVDVDFTTKTVNPPTAPAAPLGVKAEQVDNSIAVSWQASQSEKPLSQYRIMRNGSQLATVSAATLSYTDKALTAGQTYAYQIQAVDNADTASTLSNTATVTYNVVPPTTPEPPTSGGMSIRISGKNFVDQDNEVVRLVGVNRSGTQYACMDGDGFSDGPIDDASIASMKTWGINVVRVNLNEHCWLGINGVPAAYGGANYRKAIGDFVTRLHNHGMYAIIDMHHSNGGTKKAVDIVAMADRDHAVDYWKSVAAYFKDDHAVVFDLFNEPYPDNNRNTTAAWTCIRDGGTCTGVPFTAAGMQEMLNAVRDAGATQPVMISGPEYAGDLDRWLEFKPNDPQNQLAASVHIYGQPLGSPYGDDTSRWDKEIAPLAAKIPIVVGELGDSDCSHKFIDKFMPWADTHGLSYVAWAWVTSDCADEPALITNYNGTPTNFGIGFRDHVKALNLQ